MVYTEKGLWALIAFFCRGRCGLKSLISKYINREKFILHQQSVNIRLQLQTQSGGRLRSDRRRLELSILRGKWFQL